MSSQPQTTIKDPPAPWPGTIARVNMPDPVHPGYRIVGYRVPEDEAGLIDGIFKLIEWDRAHVR